MIACIIVIHWSLIYTVSDSFVSIRITKTCSLVTRCWS